MLVIAWFGTFLLGFSTVVLIEIAEVVVDIPDKRILNLFWLWTNTNFLKITIFYCGLIPCLNNFSSCLFFTKLSNTIIQFIPSTFFSDTLPFLFTDMFPNFISFIFKDDLFCSIFSFLFMIAFFAFFLLFIE